MSLTDAEIIDLVKDASRVSDRGEEGLRAFADAFIEAHQLNPGGPSLEVGTRDGGSALLFLGLLWHLYPAAHRPCLFTVDPYGSKPYDKEKVPIYTDVNYLAMKRNLSGFPNHVHFHMTSHDFFTRMHGLPYWRPGQTTVPVQSVETGVISSAPVGDQHHLRDFAFVLLDGDHTQQAIHSELWELTGGWLAPAGVVAVDNVDTDPDTRRMLEEGDYYDGDWRPYKAEFSKNGQWAFVRRA